MVRNVIRLTSLSFARPNRDGRAYLLPLLAANLVPRTAELRHFVSHFVPLSEKLFELQNTTEKEGERKVSFGKYEQVGCR
jgi:ribosomal RNA-processing protein 12